MNIGLTVTQRVADLIDAYIDKHRIELEITGRATRPAVVKEAILLFLKEQGLVSEENKE